MICVSIGRGRHRHMIAEHHHLVEQGVELVELRLDCIQGEVKLHRLLPERPGPVIVTCRRRSDGGRWAGTEEARTLLVRTAIAQGVEYVDLEDDIAADTPRFGATRRIVSHHDFTSTPPDLPALHARLARLDADIVKIATMANHPDDALRMLELVAGSSLPTVGLCMGDIGIPSRILSGRAGAPFTFATVDDDRALAPGQIPWRVLRDTYRYDALSSATKIYGVVADPVAHSLSPAVHNAALAAAGRDAVYLPFRVPAEHLEAFLAGAARWPLAGLSVTIPHKEAVLAGCLSQDELVRQIGAANTLAFGPEGIAAWNTDATAALESLRVGVVDSGRSSLVGGFGTGRALVLGAGGAARAVAFGLRREGFDVTIAARNLARGRQIAADVGCKAVDWSARHRLPSEYLVNATPVGMHPNVNETPFDKEHLRPYMVVFDTVYNPENTLLVKQARGIGCPVVTGVEMFVRQAGEQFRIWQGTDPPLDAMREALKRATTSARLPF